MSEQERMTCETCRSDDMVRDERPATFTYRGHEITFDVPGWYCRKCGDSVHSGEDIEKSDPEFAAFRARVDGLVDGRTVHRVRRKLKLSQREAGRILGGGAQAFYKYEHGLDTPTKAMSNLILLLDRHPEMLKDLVEAQEAIKPPAATGGSTPTP